MGKKLLVADDSATIQKVIKLALASEGYEIINAAEGNEAVQLINKENPDVVLIDIALPGKNAFEVKHSIDPTIQAKFILMASAFEKIDEAEVENAQFKGRLVKPFDPSTLRKSVSELMKVDRPAKSSKPKLVHEPKVKAFEPTLDDLPKLEDLMPTVEPQSTLTEITSVPPSFDLTQPASVSLTEPIVLDTSASTINSQPFSLPPMPPLPQSVNTETQEISSTSPPAMNVGADNDIRNLTESTMKMAKLDDLEWNLDDSKRMKNQSSTAVPPLVPNLKNFADKKNLHSPTEELNDYLDKTREVVRPLYLNENNSVQVNRTIDDGGSTFPLHLLHHSEELTQNIMEQPALKNKTDLISRAEIESIIKQELNEALQKAIKDLLPQMAESLIKKEIDKILAEP